MSSCKYNFPHYYHNVFMVFHIMKKKSLVQLEMVMVWLFTLQNRIPLLCIVDFSGNKYPHRFSAVFMGAPCYYAR